MKNLTRAGQLAAAAKFFNISKEELEKKTEQQQDELIKNHIRAGTRAGQLAAAAKSEGISEQELEKKTEQQQDELIKNLTRAGQLAAAAKFFNISKEELEKKTEQQQDELIKNHTRAGQLAAAAKSEGISEQELEKKTEQQQDELIKNLTRAGQLAAAAKFFNISKEELEKKTKKELDDLINDHIFDVTAEAAKSWALKQKVNDTFPFTSLPLVASTQQQQRSTAVERYLIKLSEGEEQFGSMDKDTKNKLLKDLIAEYCYFSSLEKACTVFDENFDEAKGDTWTPQERRDIIERYKLSKARGKFGLLVRSGKGHDARNAPGG